VTSSRPTRTIPGDWHPGGIPANVEVAERAVIETSYSFTAFRSTLEHAGVIGEGSTVYGGTLFDIGPRGRIAIGRCSMLNGVHVICEGAIDIGDYALISWNVVLMDSYRVPLAPEARRAFLHARAPGEARPAEASATARPIRIGHNVWIGFDACVLPGVTIGDGAVIGARSVVCEDVPALTVAAGNPARRIRTLDAP
jgi:acetyltransferase-like isoleucine patch superfamily enzyme